MKKFLLILLLSAINVNAAEFELIGGFRNLIGNKKISYYCDDPGFYEKNFYCPPEANLEIRLERFNQGEITESEVIATGTVSKLVNNGQFSKFPRPHHLRFYVTESFLDNSHGGTSILGFAMVIAVTGSIDLVTMPFQAIGLLGPKQAKNRTIYKMKNFDIPTYKRNRHHYVVPNKKLKFIQEILEKIDSGEELKEN